MPRFEIDGTILLRYAFEMNQTFFFIQVVRAKVSFVRDFLERKLVDKVRRFVMLLYNQGQHIFMKADEPKKIN